MPRKKGNAQLQAYEVRGTRGSDTLVIGCDTREVAEDTARTFRREGYAEVEIIETR